MSTKVGDLLSRFRQDKKMTQAELSKSSKVSETAITDIETGKVEKPRLATLAKLARGLGLDPFQTQELIQATRGSGQASGGPAIDAVELVLKETMSIEMLRPLYEDLIIGFARALSYHTAAKQDLRYRSWPEAIDFSSTGLSELRSSLPRLEARFLDIVGTAQLHLAETHQAALRYNEAFEIAEKLGDRALHGEICAHQGDLLRTWSDFDAASDKYSEAEREFYAVDDVVNKTRTRRKLALVHLSRGEWSQARNYLVGCCATWDSLLDGAPEGSQQARRVLYEKSKTLVALGWAEDLKGDWSAAISTRKKALEIAKMFAESGDYEDEYLTMQTHLYLGAEYITQREFDLAEKNLKCAMDLSEKLNDRKERGLIFLCQARVALNKGRSYEDAEKRFKEAYDSHREAENRYRTATTLYHWAGLYLERGTPVDLRDAEQKYLEARSIFQTLGNNYYVARVDIQLWKIYREPERQNDIEALEQEILRVSTTKENPYYQNVAYLKSLQATRAIKKGRSSAAILDLYLWAMVNAVRYNHYLCQRIAGEVKQGLLQLDTENAGEDGRKLWSRLSRDLEKECIREFGRAMPGQDNYENANALVQWLQDVTENWSPNQSIPTFEQFEAQLPAATNASRVDRQKISPPRQTRRSPA